MSRKATKQLCPSCGKSYVSIPTHRKTKKHLRRTAQQATPFASAPT